MAKDCCMSGNTTKLYNKLASWWHILSAPEEYEEEASLIKDILSHHNNQMTTLLGPGKYNCKFGVKCK